jgi:hypothetical protein
VFAITDLAVLLAMKPIFHKCWGILSVEEGETGNPASDQGMKE